MPVTNQNTQQPKNTPITISGYSQAVQDMMRTKHPDYDQVMNQTMQGAPNGQIPAVAPQPTSMNFFQPNGGAVGKYEAPSVLPKPAQPVQPVQTGEDPVTDFTNMPQQPTGWNADGTPRYDSLSSALSGAAASQKHEAPAFQSDPSKKDGGFFGWLGSLIPKKRPGMREGETPDEYDRRRTRNMEMMATLADAIRHIGNIVNTSKGAPLQQFNDPTAMMEQGYQNRKAQRQKQAALDADAAYKQANLSLKERAAEAQRAYQQATLVYKQKAEERAAKNDEFNRNFKTAGLQRQLDNDKFNHELSTKKFNETARHNKVSESQGAIRIALAQERNNMARTRLAHSIASGGGGGKSGKLTNLSSPTGHLNRTYDLNAIEKKQITQHLIKNGYINKTNLDAWTNYVSTGDTKNANDLQNYWIAYAANMPGKKGDAFRTMLKNHYMYNETSTTSAPKATRGSVVTITQKGNKDKTTKSHTTKNKFHVD
ncbi:hypothetical protein ACTQ53_09905 [Prevotella sp. Sow4_E9_plate]|uniref:hypothetical protein n=1 Tax=Prevotella sp. Sow4_E9_plate TaxID=3438802 RepID=UPI003F9DE560